MTYEIAALVRQSTSVAEVCAGAFGYLSAVVDEYLHAEHGNLDDLHSSFHRIQHEVTKGLARIFEEKGITVAMLAEGVRSYAHALDMDAETGEHIVRQAVKLAFPLTPVTKP